MRSLGQFEEEMAQVPSLPPALTSSEKRSRSRTKYSRIEENAKKLKKQARKGEIDPELFKNVTDSGSTDRRIRKAIFESRLTYFINYMRQRAEAFKELTIEQKALNQERTGNTVRAELAGKKFDFIRNLYFGVFSIFFQKFTETMGKWFEKGPPKKRKKELVKTEKEFTDSYSGH